MLLRLRASTYICSGTAVEGKDFGRYQRPQQFGAGIIPAQPWKTPIDACSREMHDSLPSDIHAPVVRGLLMMSTRDS